MRKNKRPKSSKVSKITAFIATFLVCIFVSFALPIVAQEAAVEETVVETAVTEEAIQEEAITTKDPKIPLKNLSLLIKPLTLGQVENEASSWSLLLQEKLQAISNAEIALETQGSSEESIEKSNQLKAEERAIVARFNIVLDEIDAKGGDSSSYRKYVEAISGLEKYVTDSGGLGTQVVSWFTSEEGGIQLAIDIGNSLLRLLITLLITVIAAPRLGNLAESLLSRISGLSVLFRKFIVMIIKRGVWVVGFLIALAVLGVDLGPILAVVGGASFVLAFALQSNLGNFASGLMLLINKPFDVGDEVKVAGYWAYIDSISLASTKIKDFGGNIVTLPNNTVWGGDIINYTHSDIRKLALPIKVKFSQDIERVREMWIDIATANPKVLDTPQPGWFPYSSSYTYCIGVTLAAWAKTDEYWGVYVELLKELQKRINESNIELASPQQEIIIGQNIPEEIANQIQQDSDSNKALT